MNDEHEVQSAPSGTIVRDGEPVTIDEALGALAARKAANTARRRELARNEYRLVKQDPKEVAGAIALGMVLMRLGLRAPDSWHLDGLLSGTADALVARINTAAAAMPGASAGDVLVRAIDLGAAELQAEGIYVAWKRRADAYFEEHAEWLARDLELRENGAWRHRPMTDGQEALIRHTCAILQIDLPGHLLRGSAHDWIERMGANLRYRGVRP